MGCEIECERSEFVCMHISDLHSDCVWLTFVHVSQCMIKYKGATH